MIEILAAAKINLSLKVVGRRADGYHLIDSVIVPVGLYDRLEMEIEAGVPTAVDLVSSHPDAPSGPDNLAARAARLFLERTGKSARVSLRLQKEIPVGAGLGGGSSDAAAVLHGLNRALACRVPLPTLMQWGLELGADVPVLVYGRPARVSGIGDNVQGLPACPRWAVVLAAPGRPLATKEVYAAYDRSLTSQPALSNNATLSEGLPLSPESLVNDLEAAASQILPELHALKRKLLEHGAAAAVMTGSGSVVFGVWRESAAAEAVAMEIHKEGTWARAVTILDCAPAVEESSRDSDGR